MPKVKIIAWSLLLTISACQTKPAGVRPEATPQFFFDLKGYFQEETDRLNAEQPRLKKIVAVNGHTEEKILTEQDYEKELAVFLNADINRPAWSDQYLVDSILVAGRLEAISYQANSSDLRVQSIRIHFAGEGVDEIIIDKKADNLVAGSTQHLEYRPGTGYQIISSQKTAVSKEKELTIEVRFLR